MIESEAIKICNTIGFATSLSNPQGVPLNTTKEELIEAMRMSIQALEKQGGISDDVCEWKSIRDGEFIQNPHTRRTFSNEPSMQNVYCNTCGKKIKVVE